MALVHYRFFLVCQGKFYLHLCCKQTWVTLSQRCGRPQLGSKKKGGQPMSESYLTPEQKIRQRFSWFQEARRLGNVKLTCLRLGISRKTFYKWKKRWSQAQGIHSTLLDRSRPPITPNDTSKRASNAESSPSANNPAWALNVSVNS